MVRVTPPSSRGQSLTKLLRGQALTIAYLFVVVVLAVIFPDEFLLSDLVLMFIGFVLSVLLAAAIRIVELLIEIRDRDRRDL